MMFSAVLAACTVFASAAGGFFRTEKIDGVWHLSRSGDEPMRILSTSHVGFLDDDAKAGREWAKSTRKRLAEWGFNTVGNPVREFKSDTMPYFRYIQFTPRFMLEDPKDEDRWILGPMKKGSRKRFPNVFSPKWADFCRREAARCATRHSGDRDLIGYFTDNELRWFGHAVTNGVSGLMDVCLAKKDGHSAKKAAVGFLAKRGLSVDNEIPVSVKRDFLAHVAEIYYSTVAGAIRAADPNHLVLGSRIHAMIADGIGPDILVAEACARHCDVVSVNSYPWVDMSNGEVWSRDPAKGPAYRMKDLWRQMCVRTGKPVFVSEWSFVATDSGLPCTKGAGQVFETQAERVRAAEINARLMLSEPGIIGYNFFKWRDDPMPDPNAKRKAENKNYGLVSIDDISYTSLTEMFTRLHREVGRARCPQRAAGPDWFGDWPSDARPADISRRISEQFLSTVPDRYKPENGYRGNNGYGGGNSVHYSVVSLWANALDCARLTGDKPLENRLVIAFEPYYGIKKDIQPRFKHVDFTIFGAVPLGIAILTGDERAKALGMKYADMQWEEPKRDDPPPWYNVMSYEERMDWWRKGYSDQTRLWIDDAYMIASLQTQAYRLTGDMKYVERAAKEAVLYLDRLQKPNGLFHHSPEVPFYWGRGNGWMAGAMPLILKYLPKDSAFRPRIMEGYLKMMSTLLAAQREDGMWGQLVDDPESWSESSGTAMFAYAFAEGVRHGWLDAAKYGPAMRRAYLALVARMDEWGNVSSVCVGTAAKNDRDYYLKRAKVNGDSHGQAAILWLCRTMLEVSKGGEVKVSSAEPLPDYFSPKWYSDRISHKYELLNRKTDGFRGVWYYCQSSGDEYVYKYSGGMGVYCAGHIPMAVYSKEADKTFFCFGGTDERNSTLLQSVSYFDHKTGLLARPTVVYNKYTLDAHDNAVISMDDRGYIYLFSSAHGQWRPAAIARSVKPYDISKFETIWEGNYSYPQPFYVPGKGFLFLHAWYVTDGSRNIGSRSNRFMTSNEDGTVWSERSLLAYFNEGHYQRAWPFGTKKIGVAFDQHPVGKGLNWRTDVFYMETDDFGKTWKAASGEVLKTPLDRRENPALAVRYEEKSRNVYIKGVKYDRQGRPIVLYIVSKGYRAGPTDGPREWKIVKWTGSAWREIDTGIRSGNNYDYAELYVDSDSDWRIIGASKMGAQPYNPGGEIAAWRSCDAGETWRLEKMLTEGSAHNQNYPRQPLNVNGGFYAFWADGHGRKPSVSRLYFCDSDLNVYVMPLSFEGDFAKPIPYKKGK